MTEREDEEDDARLSNAAFSAHLRQFGYTPPSKGTGSKTPPFTSSNKAGVTVNKEDGKVVSGRRKRKLSVGTSPSLRAVSPSPMRSQRRTTTKERSAKDPYEPENKLVDSLRPGLMLVFIGLNPGLETARTGHAYAHATNQFWPLLYNSGITPIRHKAADTHILPDLYNIGNTNLCVRATRSGDGLSKQEQADGAKIVEEKIARYKPEAVCIVGKGIWDTVYKSKTGKMLKRQEFAYGWQDEEFWLGRAVDENGDVSWVGARTFVCTSTSGLAADTKPAEKLAIMSKLGDWVKERRRELTDVTGEKVSRILSTTYKSGPVSTAS